MHASRHRRQAVVALLAISATLVSLAHPAAAAPKSRPAPCRNGYVSLSFDDGPTAMTPALLFALRKAELRVTFFDVGERADQYPSHVRAQVMAGHAVGNHSYDHVDLVAIGDAAATDQLARTQTILSSLIGTAPTLFRPPYGSTSAGVEAAATGLGLTQVIWTVDTRDWSGPSVSSIVASALEVQPGGFVLMHEGYANTISAIPKIAAGLEARGLCAGRIVPSDVPVRAWDGLYFDATVTSW